MTMSHTLVIASCELRERSRVFLMAAALAVVPFLTALVPAAGSDRPLVITGVAGFLALALAFGVVIMQGTSTVAGELAAKRISFYFTKPLSPAAIWFGKTLAALAISVICFAIVVVPALLFTGNQWERTFGSTRLFGLFAIGLVAMFLVSHALSTMIRSRSGLVGVDFLLAAIAGGAIFAIVKPLFLAGSTLAASILAVIGAAIVVILLLAPVWQLAQGRTDIRRSHVALSRALWIPLAAVLLVAGAYVAWVVRIAPTDLVSITNIEQAPGGNTMFLSGSGRGRGDYQSSFLVDVQTGRYARVSGPSWWGVRYSQDGNVVAWVQPVTILPVTWEIFTKRLDQPDAPIHATGISKGVYGTTALSPDGSRLAMMNDATLSVHDLTTHRLLAAAARPAGTNGVALFFTSNDVVRLYQSPRGSSHVDIYELDTRTKKMAKTGELDSPTSYNGLRSSSDGTRVLFPRAGVVVDGRSGAVVAKLPVTTQNIFATGILADGTIAIARRVAPQLTQLSLFAPDGTSKHELALPAHYVWLSGEIDGGRLIAIGSDQVSTSRSGKGRRMFVIDPARGTVERTMNDLRGPTPNWGDLRLTHFRADAKLAAVNAQGTLVTWNATTGAVAKFPD
jgi:hypothetical protein